MQPIYKRVKEEADIRKLFLTKTDQNEPFSSNLVSKIKQFAGVAKLVDVPDLGSGAVRHWGSSPSTRTLQLKDEYELKIKNYHIPIPFDS